MARMGAVNAAAGGLLSPSPSSRLARVILDLRAIRKRLGRGFLSSEDASLAIPDRKSESFIENRPVRPPSGPNRRPT